MDYDDAAEKSAVELQRAADPELSGEVLTPGQVVTLAGEDFRIAERVGLMPLLKFSHAANLRTDDDRALAAMYEILRDVILEAEDPCGRCPECIAAGDSATARDCKVADEGDWDRFCQHAVDCKADADELLDVVSQAVKLISARPTVSRPGSSPGSRVTSRRSTGTSSAKRGAASNRSARGRRAT